jgi:hypothetical protein
MDFPLASFSIQLERVAGSREASEAGSGPVRIDVQNGR